MSIEFWLNVGDNMELDSEDIEVLEIMVVLELVHWSSSACDELGEAMTVTREIIMAVTAIAHLHADSWRSSP